MISVFEFTDYKAYLRKIEADRAQIQKGFRSRLAEVLNCQNAYITQVLNTHANLSLEQGIRVSRFLQLDEVQTRFFLLLIEHARAGTLELKSYFERDLSQLREEYLKFENRVSNVRTLFPEQQSIYYSSWLYPAVHIIVTIPKFRKIPEIARALSVSEKSVREVVLFLVNTELLIEKNGFFHTGPVQLHLSKESPHIRQHHSNWRIRAAQAIPGKNSSDLHYSTVSSLSRVDAERIQMMFKEMIQQYIAILSPSKEETLYNFNIDFHCLVQE